MSKVSSLCIVMWLFMSFSAANANDYLHQANAEFLAQKYSKAETYYRLALRSDKNNSFIYLRIAECEFIRGKTKISFTTVNRAIALDAQLTDAYVLRARLNGLKNDWEQARVDYQIALVQNPDHLAAQFGLAESMQRLGDSVGANAEFKKYQNMRESR